MSRRHPADNDESVRKVLHEWEVTALLPPRFTERVWQRIERAEATVRPALFDVWRAWLTSVIRRPAVAVSYIALLLTVGMATGQWQAGLKISQLDGELERRYVHTVDPYQKPRL